MGQSTYTPEKAEAILFYMREGKSLRQACEICQVNKTTFLRWVDDVEGLADQYTRAREDMLDAQAEELESIGDEAARAETAVQVAGLRLKADNRKWLLSKLAPKRYGDRLEIDQKTTLTDLTEEQIDARLARLLEASAKA